MTKTVLNKNLPPEVASTEIANKFINEFLESEKQGKLVGEWIIYAKLNGKNHYLTLANHKEDDIFIRNRILDNCKEQFPFLDDLLKN